MARLYRDVTGERYLSIGVGQHLDTGENFVTLKRQSDGAYLYLPQSALGEVVICNGQRCYRFTLDRVLTAGETIVMGGPVRKTPLHTRAQPQDHAIKQTYKKFKSE